MAIWGPQWSVTVSRNIFDGLISFSSLLALGLSSATLAATSSLEILNDVGQFKLQESEMSGLSGKRGKNVFQASQQLLNKRSMIALFEQYCLLVFPESVISY